LLLQNLGESEGARAMLDRALHVVETNLGRTHPDFAVSLESLGFHYYQRGEYDQALRQYQRALKVREEIFGVGHGATGWNLYDQSCILALNGDAEGALAHLHRALDVGWANARIFEDDDFDSLRGNPAFEAILEEVRARL
jgi:tetratricopeptide (TPR) repeat protein